VLDLPDTLAKMWAQDAASQSLGISLLAVDNHSATLSLSLQAQHLNSLGIAHGGVIFTLADSAFAYASNSTGESAVSQASSITYLAPGQPGDTLTAHAALISRAGRSAIYDVTVRNDSGATLALMRAQARFVAV
jgi:acyl-CoA thioesterase